MPSLTRQPLSVLEAQYGARFGQTTTIDNITQQMLAAGNDARGIVAGFTGQNSGHVFNVINKNGTILFLDGQTGTVANINNKFVGFSLMRTP